MFADIAHGHTDLADLAFLVALIVFALAAVMHVMAKQVPAALVAVGLAAVALGWLVL